MQVFSVKTWRKQLCLGVASFCVVFTAFGLRGWATFGLYSKFAIACPVVIGIGFAAFYISRKLDDSISIEDGKILLFNRLSSPRRVLKSWSTSQVLETVSCRSEDATEFLTSARGASMVASPEAPFEQGPVPLSSCFLILLVDGTLLRLSSLSEQEIGYLQQVLNSPQIQLREDLAKVMVSKRRRAGRWTLVKRDAWDSLLDVAMVLPFALGAFAWSMY